MSSRRTLEFVAGIVASGGVAGVASLHTATAYALAIGLAVGTPALVRTSSRFDRTRYLRRKSGSEQALDSLLAGGSTLAVGLVAGYVAVNAGYSGAVAAAVAAAFGVLAGQAVFYVRNSTYIG